MRPTLVVHYGPSPSSGPCPQTTCVTPLPPPPERRRARRALPTSKRHAGEQAKCHQHHKDRKSSIQCALRRWGTSGTPQQESASCYSCLLCRCPASTVDSACNDEFQFELCCSQLFLRGSRPGSQDRGEAGSSRSISLIGSFRMLGRA